MMDDAANPILHRVNAGMDRVLMRTYLRQKLKMAFDAGYSSAQRGITSEDYHAVQVDALLDFIVAPIPD